MVILVWSLHVTCIQLHVQHNYSVRTMSKCVVTPVSWFSKYYEEKLQM